MSKSLHRALCLPVTLYNAWKVVKSKNSAGGIDGLSVDMFEERLKVNLEELRRDLIDKKWNPEPYLKVEIEKKGSADKRKLGLLTVRDKIVQQAIKSLIEPRMEKMFLNNSYGYRPGRGPVKAIHRTKYICDRIKKGWIAKLDIDDYFDTIQHERLFLRLNNLLKDDEVIRLVELSVKTGIISNQLKWNETTKGIPQGAVLSPLLANFYLHPFDQFVLAKTPNYVRYADDFVLMAETKEQLEEILRIVKAELEKSFHLRLNTPILANIDDGVEFLGITVCRAGLSLSEKKKEDLLSRIETIELKGTQFTKKSLETLQGIKNYYAHLLPQPLLKELDNRLIKRIHEQVRENKNEIPNKTTLATDLKELFFFADETELSKSVLIREFVDSYIEVCTKKQGKPQKVDNKKLINQKKREYQKREMEGSELIVTTPGSFIGKTNKGIVIKVKGVLQNKKPTHALKHITVIGQGVTISSNAIRYCMQAKIPIDFFDEKGKHYASVLSPVIMDGMLWQQQALLGLDKKIELGRRFILSKLKNQMNLVKYYHKYHKETTDVLTQRYPGIILRLEECINRVKTYSEINPDYTVFFMGQEAVAANAYWEYIRLLLLDDGVDFYKREHQGAKDLMNCMLNYGYAILYGRIWDALLSQKLNPSISVLHAFQPGKPTFVFDVIELFRAQAVDRVAISLIQKGETLKVSNGLLTESTKQILIGGVLERLNRYENYRGESIRLEDIIRRQVNEIAAFISGESKTFKPYLAKW